LTKIVGKNYKSGRKIGTKSKLLLETSKRTKTAYNYAAFFACYSPTLENNSIFISNTSINYYRLFITATVFKLV